jgi:hypothetical protein
MRPASLAAVGHALACPPEGAKRDGSPTLWDAALEVSAFLIPLEWLPVAVTLVWSAWVLSTRSRDRQGAGVLS